MYSKAIRAIVFVSSKNLIHAESDLSLLTILQCVMAPSQLLLGRWLDEDVVLMGVETDVRVAIRSQIQQRAWLSDYSDEWLGPCTLSVLRLSIKVERSKSNRGTLTYRRTLLTDPQLRSEKNVGGK
jgi:hypothetical protein